MHDTGLLTAIRKEYLRVVNYQELLFNDFGDRVAQLIHVASVAPFSQNHKDSFHQEFLIVNTHLLFPHDSSLSIARLHQVPNWSATYEPYFVFINCFYSYFRFYS